MKNKYGKIMPFLLVCFLVSTVVKAQDRYRITYDYKTENITYLVLDKNGKVVDTLSNPKLKRNSIVEVKIKNVNPFAVQVNTDVKEEDSISAGQGFNFSSLLGGINSFAGDKIDLNTTNLHSSDVFKSASLSRGNSSVTSDFEDLNNIMTNVSALKATLLSNLINPNLDKAAIIENLNATADAEQDVRVPSAKDNFYVYLAKVEKTIKESRSQLENNINSMSSEVENLVVDNINVSRGELVSRNSTLIDLQKMITNLSQSTDQSMESLRELSSLYTILEASNFEQIYDYELTSDRTTIKLKFTQSEFSNELKNDSSPAILKERNIRIVSKGGFKINTSVAMTLNNFGSTSNDYFIDASGALGTSKNDYFVPNLSTMINFYPYLSENFNVGGSFGLSVPISGSENISGVNFLFGPSIFLGSKSRLAISGGVAYGPVKRLTNGLEVGDIATSNSVDAFVKNVYDFGYYFGISFSLFDLK